MCDHLFQIWPTQWWDVISGFLKMSIAILAKSLTFLSLQCEQDIIFLYSSYHLSSWGARCGDLPLYPVHHVAAPSTHQPQWSRPLLRCVPPEGRRERQAVSEWSKECFIFCCDGRRLLREIHDTASSCKWYWLWTQKPSSVWILGREKWVFCKVTFSRF